MDGICRDLPQLLDGVSLGIKIHPRNLNGLHLLAVDFMNN